MYVHFILEPFIKNNKEQQPTKGFAQFGLPPLAYHLLVLLINCSNLALANRVSSGQASSRITDYPNCAKPGTLVLRQSQSSKIYSSMTRIILLLLITNSIFGQAKLNLTKQQMFADYDTLVQTIVKTSPSLLFKKDLWHYNVQKGFGQLRKSIDTISNDLSFYILLCKALNAAQDGHTDPWVQEEGWAKKQSEIFGNYSDRFRLSIPNTYINGRYFVREPFYIKDDTIQIGTEITHFNGLAIDKYLETHMNNEIYEYDMEKKKFFYAGFFRNLETIFEDSVIIRFKSEQGISKSYRLPTNKFTKYFPDKGEVGKDTTRVEYWDKERILYIRLRKMDTKVKPYLKTEIAKYRNTSTIIDKIVLDFRGNPGGQDNVWQVLYADLIADTIKYTLKIDDYPNGVITKERIKRAGYTVVGDFQQDNNPLLKKYGLITLVNTEETLGPSPYSLKFKGNIYILAENIFSSAGSALSVANKNPNDNLITVGRKTGVFLGIGFSPEVFTLPVTKFKYRVISAVEVSGIKKLDDILQNKLDIQIPYSIDEFKANNNYIGNKYKREFLIENDSFIKAVINHKPNRKQGVL
ncbi:MAG: S41 family peptidase [Sphingobacteriia bacterium]